jgi:hypothetical protein
MGIRSRTPNRKVAMGGGRTRRIHHRWCKFLGVDFNVWIVNPSNYCNTAMDSRLRLGLIALTLVRIATKSQQMRK